jgi:hypothetical protein
MCGAPLQRLALAVHGLLVLPHRGSSGGAVRVFVFVPEPTMLLLLVVE